MTERDEIFRDIQTVLKGHSEAEVLHALLQCTLVAIGVASESLPRAEAVIDALPLELKPLLRANWASYRRHRAVAGIASTIPVKAKEQQP